MKIEHIAIWAEDIEGLKDFYVRYFDARFGRKYQNTATGFESYFLRFDSGARLEIMQMASVSSGTKDPSKNYTGLAHFAISVGSRDQVDELTNRVKADGFQVLDGPRMTGDGYYESVVLDTEGNTVEITV
ncbi:MAG: VOC family protein [Betaproteobacteria bacterium]|nr:MAG: VOC family protein [Betaproteobacteria bacterium]